MSRRNALLDRKIKSILTHPNQSICSVKLLDVFYCFKAQWWQLFHWFFFLNHIKTEPAANIRWNCRATGIVVLCRKRAGNLWVLRKSWGYQSAGLGFDERWIMWCIKLYLVNSVWWLALHHRYKCTSGALSKI